MAKSASYRGVYWGINRQGKVDCVYESFAKGAASLHHHGTTHPVMPGHMSQSEVIIVFGLTDVQYVHGSVMGSEMEKQIIAD